MFIIEKSNLSYTLSAIVLILFILSASSTSKAKVKEYQPQPCIEWTLNNDSHEDLLQDCALDYRKMNFKCMGTVNTSILSNFNSLRNVKEIGLCGWQNSTFDPSVVMKYFPKAEYLDISYGKLSDIVNNFPDSLHLQIINISYTGLTTIKVNAFKFVRNLKVLDLRFNKLKYMEAPPILPSGLQQLYLSGNTWNCSRSLRSLYSLEKTGIVVDLNIMVCSDPKYQGRNLVTVAYYKRLSKIECQSHPELRNCSCTVQRIVKTEDGKSLMPIYAVNCSRLDFYALPSYLPRNTTVFAANNNQISDIRPLRDNEMYRNVVDVYLDNNKIRSIDVLEAGFWLRHFRILSLKRNQLQRFPVYAVDNALEYNSNAVNLQLSQNPWMCDCKFTMRFREILMKYHTIIQDSGNITCNFTTEDNNFVQAKVLSMQRIDICKLPTDDSIFPLDLLNGILASLILFVLAKLGYDYYHYKNYGHLPWIVTKLP